MAVMSSKGQEFPIKELEGELKIFKNEEGWNVIYDAHDLEIHSVEDDIGYALYQFHDLLRTVFWMEDDVI